MGKIDELDHAVDHRVAQRDERVDGAEREAVGELLEEKLKRTYSRRLKVEGSRLPFLSI